MRARSIINVKEDDRDEDPCYRVDFWARPAPGYAWNSDVWLIDGAPDVSAVIAWAEAHARGQRYQVLVKNRSRTEESYTLLQGANPNDPNDPY